MKRREVASLFLLTVVPLLLGGRGQVNADTKQYLYLDPFDLLDRSRSVWDSRVGGGAVTHQGIGYLWPMGPYYALTDALGMPDWASQRLWVGLLQLAAATGALALLRHLLPRTWVHVPAAAAYGLSPFVLGHVTNVSGLLVPFAGLGWLVLCMAKAVEEPRSWRWPAAFALIVTTCGSLNGSSVLFVVLAAALWVPFAVGRTREDRRHGLRILVRAGALTLVTQVWWLVAYAVGGAYNLPILETTETVQVTNGTTSALEVLRGLGYWFFYGDDTEGLWLRGLATPYLRSGVLLVVTFAIPLLALFAGAVTRWRHRAYFTLLVVGGTFIAVGAYPIADPSPLGDAFERISRSSDAVLSLRNTQRAGALVALGLAALLGAGLTALHQRHRRAGAGAAIALLVLVAAAMPAQWRSGLVAERGHRPEELPAAWTEAMAALDEGEGRILELPGSDFAAYRWGETLDPVSVGLTDRPIIARELVPLGGDAGADLLEALDRSIQEGWFEPAALAPVARLLGASDVLVRNDLAYERYRTARPGATWPLLSSTGTGLNGGARYGPGYRNTAGPQRPMVDEIELGLSPGVEYPQVARFEVPRGGREPLSTATSPGTIVDGDGEGVVSAAAVGLLDDPGLVLLGADLVAHGDAAELAGDARVVLTDSNRKRAKRWYSLRANAGATEPADRTVVPEDPSDARLEVAGTTRPGTQTVVEWRGIERVWANDYGTTGYLLPEDRPSNALDGDPATAWRAELGTRGERRGWGVELEDAIDADHVTLVAPQGRYGTVAVTRVRITLDGDRRIDADLAPGSTGPDGVEVALDGRPFRRLEVEILQTQPAAGRGGFAEVRIPGVRFEEVVRLPHALADQIGDDLSNRLVAIVLTRLRANPAEVDRADPEPSMVRAVRLPTALDVSVLGTARLDANAPEPLLDELLGAGRAAWGVTATSTARLRGDLDARASSVLDGDVTTAWQTPLSDVEGQAITVASGEPVTTSTLELDLVADDRHSVPTEVRLDLDEGEPITLRVPRVGVADRGGATHVSLPLPREVTSRTWRLEITGIEPRTTTDWQTLLPFTLPVGIAELGLPGVPERPVPTEVTTGCRDDLVEVAGEPVSVEVRGEPTDDSTAGGLELAACGGGSLRLDAGDTLVRTTASGSTGLAIDRLNLLSSPGAHGFPPDAEAPTVESRRHRPGHISGTVETDGAPFWLVVDESMDEGWDLDVEGARVSGPRPVDSYAAGFYVVPDGPGTLSVTARWTPQRAVDVALAISALAALVCVVLVVRGGRRGLGEEVPIDAPLLVASAGPPRWAALAAALLAGLLVAPEAMIPAGLLVLVAWRWPRLGSLLPVALVAGSAAAVVVLQVGHEHPASFVWPTRFHWVHPVTAVALIVIAVLAVTAKPGDGAPVSSPP